MKSTITSKSQLTILKSIRTRMQLRTGNKMEFILDDENGIRLIPLTASVVKLKGMVPKPKKSVSMAAMNRAVENRNSAACDSTVTFDKNAVHCTDFRLLR